MALRASAPLSPFWHTPEGQGEDATKFKIRGLTGLELSEVNADAKADYETKTVKFGAAAMRAALGFALLGWENFQDADGGQIAFNDKNRGENIERLPFEVIGDLFGEILKSSRVGETQQKN